MSRKQLALLKYALKRVSMMLPLLFVIAFVVFIVLNFAPGDPAVLMGGVESSEENIERLRIEFGLNDVWYIQFWHFIKQIVLHGDFGRSFQYGTPVIEEIARTLPISAQLTLNGILISVSISLFIGVLSAVRKYSFLDNITKIVVLAGVSMPVFWLGLVLIVVFSVYLGIFPSSGWGGWKHMILPSLAISAYPLATLTRLTRSTMLGILQQNYIRTARAKGLSENAIIYKHALRNAYIPITTVIGLQFGVLFSGSILTETVFAIPGVGSRIIMAIYARDYAIIRGIILLSALLFLIINLIVDLCYSFFDPRIKY